MAGRGLSYSFAGSPSQVIVFQVLVLLRLHHRYPVAALAASNASRGSRPVTDFASIFRRASNPETLPRTRSLQRTKQPHDAQIKARWRPGLPNSHFNRNPDPEQSFTAATPDTGGARPLGFELIVGTKNAKVLFSGKSSR
jgi:hypothetical protein